MRLVSRVLAVLLVLACAGPAWASCSAVASRPGPGPQFAALDQVGLSATEIGLTFVGHASFLIESPQGVTIVTDYNDYIRPAQVPTIATMNVAHSTHNSASPDPRIKHLLRGWNPNGGAADHQVTERDVFVRNIPTNIRSWEGGTRTNGNSIFIFEVADLCLVHLGHLHHELTREDLGILGEVDVLMVPVDGAVTMTQAEMIEVVRQIRPRLVVPMHFFGSHTLDRFLAGMSAHYPVKRSPTAHVVLSRATLPDPPEVLVLPGRH